MANEISVFSPARTGTRLAPGLILEEKSEKTTTYFRITHVFEKRLFVMTFTTAEAARDAKRPHPLPLDSVLKKIKDKKIRVGRIRLPTVFQAGPDDDSQEADVDIAFERIEPVLHALESESKLGRWEFTRLLVTRADALGMKKTTLRRLVLRYYYFGRQKNSLLPFRPGPAPDAAPTLQAGKAASQGARRGRQPIIAKELGPATFIVSDDDILDMIAALERCAGAGTTTLKNAHGEYLKLEFAKRRPAESKKFLAGKCPPPVSVRQFRDYVRRYETLRDELRLNVPALAEGKGAGTLTASGPGEIYEIDATGGRIFLVDSKNRSKILGTPVIYLLIDRWSRFIVSVYITLNPPSWEEIKCALLIAFTSRVRRFENLGVNVSEKRWPRGVVCACLARDRGSEMVSEAMMEAAKELRIEPLTMPARCPDGKGIIERLIGVMKAKMSGRGIQGTFKERPLTYESKKAAKEARKAAANTLREIYWDLLDIVDDHNNRPHSGLKKNALLRRNRIPPIPRDAFIWGLKNVTGVRSPPFEDEDYQRLLLGVDSGSISKGRVTLRGGRTYLPFNALARRRARSSPVQRKAIKVRLDRSDPVDLFIPEGDDGWSHWSLDKAGRRELRETTLDEEHHLHDTYRLDVARADNDALIADVKRPGSKRRQPTTADPAAKEHTKQRRRAESEDVKRALVGKAAPRASAQPAAKARATPIWKEREQQEKLQILAARSRK